MTSATLLLLAAFTANNEGTIRTFNVYASDMGGPVTCDVYVGDDVLGEIGMGQARSTEFPEDTQAELCERAALEAISDYEFWYGPFE